jgi:predicted TPR repeat methyltransferase
VTLLKNSVELRRSDVLLLDRRKREIGSLRLSNSRLTIVSTSQYSSPLGPIVYVVTLKRIKRITFPLPKLIRSEATIYKRVLDRFYLPRISDPALSTALFDLCASLYDTVIDRKRNVRNICQLLRTVIGNATDKRRRLKVLDFGCGTGLSMAAMEALPKKMSARIDLYGTDASSTMLTQASAKGLRILKFSEWQAMLPGSFDAIIASFVLHCGILDIELRTIGRQLRPGGIFVANYFGASQSTLSVFRARAIRLAFAHVQNISQQLAKKNPILICKAQD